MDLFLDSSALVAIIAAEAESESLSKQIDEADACLLSATVIWEASSALAKMFDRSPAEALRIVEDFVERLDLAIVPIGLAEGRAAVGAHARYGKGVHDAALNFGDCFSYACARTNKAKLLYKGDDFARTDLA